nr:MAG TPA: hypothetical protein [Caudoviricetes sp.]
MFAIRTLLNSSGKANSNKNYQYASIYYYP